MHRSSAGDDVVPGLEKPRFFGKVLRFFFRFSDILYTILYLVTLFSINYNKSCKSWFFRSHFPALSGAAVLPAARPAGSRCAECIPCGRAFSLMNDEVSVKGYNAALFRQQEERVADDGFRLCGNALVIAESTGGIRDIFAPPFGRHQFVMLCTGADVLLGIRHQCSAMRNGCAILPQCVFVEVAEHADCVGRRRQDRTGQIQLRSSTITIMSMHLRQSTDLNVSQWLVGLKPMLVST